MFGRKVVYVRCITCSYNNVAKGVRLLDKNIFVFIQEKIHASKSFRKIYPIKQRLRLGYYEPLAGLITWPRGY